METTEQTKKKRPFGFYVCCLAFTFERFSFYSAKWLMTMFVASSVIDGGLGLTDVDAAKMSANLVAFTYLAPLLGGYISDHWVGARYLVPVGMLMMGIGYLVAWKATSAGMVNLMILLVSVGTGLFKPQTNAITGRLFPDKDELDNAFSTQYSFVNIGSFIGTTSVGVIALSQGYSFCFLICAIMMFVDAVWFTFGWRYLGDAGKKPFKIDENKVKDVETEEYEKQPLTAIEKKRVWAIILVSAFSIIFWVFWYLIYMPVYFSKGSGLVDWSLGGMEVPTAWFDSLNAFMCIALGPTLGILWAKDAKRANGGLSMFKHTSIGMIIEGASFVCLALTDIVSGGQGASVLWMVLVGVLLSVGEMVFSPLGNSFITKFAPAKLLSNMMAIWVLAIFFAGKSYGYLYEFTLNFKFSTVYLVIAAIAVAAGIVLWALDGKLNSLIVDDEEKATA